MKTRILTMVVTALVTTGAAYGQVPEAGLAAEGAGRWDDALHVYQQTLDREPGRTDLWVRVADIEARLGHLDSSIAALDRAARSAPGDPVLYERLSKAYAEANQPAAALQAIQGAMKLQPGNPADHRAAAILATWLGNYHLAELEYREVVQLGEADAEAILNLARVSAWSGNTDGAVDAYRRYLAMHGEDAPVWLELARTESWRGNYGAAQDALDTYMKRFGKTDAYVRELAGVFARGGRPTHAMDLLDPLLAQDPSNYDLNLARTLALAQQGRPRETFDALDTVRHLKPSGLETQSAEKTVRLYLGSSVQPGASFYSDSDHLTIQRYAPWGRALFSSGTHIAAGYDHEILDAPVASGLGRADGASATYDLGWAAVGQIAGPATFEARIGAATTDTQKLTPYSFTARVRAADAVTIIGEYSSGFVVISPKTLELGLTEKRDRVAVEWDPAARYHVSVDANYQDLSDGNARKELTATVRRALARTGSLNLDFGGSAYLLGADEDLPNGYYDPQRYENYSFVLFPYFKVSENVGLGMSLAAGVQREAPSPSFQFGGNAGVEASIGIYRPWVLKIGASVTNNRRSESGAFNGFGSSVVLIRRF